MLTLQEQAEARFRSRVRYAVNVRGPHGARVAICWWDAEERARVVVYARSLLEATQRAISRELLLVEEENS